MSLRADQHDRVTHMHGLSPNFVGSFALICPDLPRHEDRRLLSTVVIAPPVYLSSVLDGTALPIPLEILMGFGRPGRAGLPGEG